MKRDANRTLVLIALAMAVAMNISALAGPDRALIESSVFRIEIDPPGSGTGFLIDDGGWAVTNDHVIRGAAAATAVFEDGAQAEISVWVAWPDHDLALIRLDLDRPR
jgi:S1-C subfamily serine protease